MDNEVTDSISDSDHLAPEADIYIYKDSSKTAVDDLQRFFKTINEDEKKEFNIPHEMTSHLRELKSRGEELCIPTIHETLTRFLIMEKKKPRNIDSDNELKCNITAKIKSNLITIKKMNSNGTITGMTDDEIDTITNKIRSNKCKIEELDRIYERTEDIVKKLRGKNCKI